MFLIFKEIQNGAVAKSYMTTASSYLVKYLRISSYIRKSFLIYDFATAEFFSFSLLSVQKSGKKLWLRPAIFLVYMRY